MRSENPEGGGGGSIPIPDSPGEEATFITICISNGGLKCHRVLISTTSSFGDKVIYWYTGLPLRPLYNSIRLLSFLLLLRIPILTVQECQSYSQFHNCNYLSRFLILPKELHLGGFQTELP